MRNSYMVEYQSNYDLNTERRADKINEVDKEIDNQENAIQALKSQKNKQKSCLDTFFNMRVNQARIRLVLSAWRQQHKK